MRFLLKERCTLIVVWMCALVICFNISGHIFAKKGDQTMNIIKRSTESDNATFDPHTEPHYDVTPGQMTFFLIWIGCFILWVTQYLEFIKLDGRIFGKESDTSKDTDKTSEKESLTENEKESSLNSVSNSDDGQSKHAGQNGSVNIGVKEEQSQLKDIENGTISKPNASASNGTKKQEAIKNFSAVRPPPTFQEFLFKVVIFGAILIFFFLCDYRKIFPKGERVYNRDLFMFLVFLLFLVASAFTLTPNTDKILNRDQTEEWKGWMQVMFVWYHVFAAKEWYNWIRVYIAAYVWMTGFGNFSFFWVRKDFSIWRFLKMQFRLNFLVTCVCVVTNNEYMLYYICAMHSYWFVSVYVFMGVLNSWNTDRTKMAIKFIAYFLCNLFIFEVSVIRDNIFRPLWIILQYHSPKYDLMHEWVFRAGLDHWSCFVGMLCAYNYPNFENFMKNVEKSENFVRKLVTKLAMIAVCIITLCLWYVLFMREDKFKYNSFHPYTSPVPIICFIVIRNSFPVLRQYHVSMFAWLGKITLETYLSQLHVYLQSNAKDLIRYLPLGYPMLNFSLATIIYLIISHKLFDLTTDFSAYLIPKEMRTVCKNALLIAVIFGIPYTFLSFMHLIV